MVRVVAALAILASACGGARTARSPAPPAPSTAPAPASEQPVEDPFAVEPAPAGYLSMQVVGVAPIGDSNAVVITDAERTVLVPIMVGDTEAMAITFRLNDQPLPRPITHDLIDTLLARFHARLVKVQVDKLEGGIFYGSIYLRHHGKLTEIDARPSDAIALALGAGVPIYVAEEVVSQAGISSADLERGGPGEGEPGEGEGEPDKPSETAPAKMPPPPEVPDALKPKK